MNKKMGEAKRRKQHDPSWGKSKDALTIAIATNPLIKEAFDFVNENLSLEIIDKTDYVDSFNHYYVSIKDKKTGECVEGCIHIFATLDNALHHQIYPNLTEKLYQAGDSIRKLTEQQEFGMVLFNKLDEDALKGNHFNYVLDPDAPIQWLGEEKVLEKTKY